MTVSSYLRLQIIGSHCERAGEAERSVALTSGYGTKRTCESHQSMSAFGGRADIKIEGRRPHVARSGPSGRSVGWPPMTLSGSSDRRTPRLGAYAICRAAPPEATARNGRRTRPTRPCRILPPRSRVLHPWKSSRSFHLAILLGWGIWAAPIEVVSSPVWQSSCVMEPVQGHAGPK
jgi:hypothetical protein